MKPRAPGPLLRRLLRAPAVLYDWRLGWLLGHRFLCLTHVGRRSGLPHQTVLEVLRWDPKQHEAIVMSGLGPRSDWFRNVEALGAQHVAIGRQRFVPDHRILADSEAGAVLEAYERRNRLLAPVVRRTLSWLVGWPYDGSDAARAKLVREIPFVAFTARR